MSDERTAFLRLGWFPWAVTFAAVLVRARAYVANHALWLDEAYLGRNIIHRDYAELARPLEYDQGAPLGFLYLSRTAVVAFGDSECVLRLVLFAASIAPPFLSLLLAPALFLLIAAGFESQRRRAISVARVARGRGKVFRNHVGSHGNAR